MNFITIQFLIYFLVRDSFCVKNRSKMKQLLKSKIFYNDTIVYYYGSKSNKFNNFVASLHYFELTSQELDHCNKGFKGKYCYNQAKNAISSENPSKLIVILNCDTSIINGMSIKFIDSIKHQEKLVLVYSNIEKFGVNLFGNKLKVLEILEPLTLDKNLNDIEPFLDHDENMFSLVDVWKYNQIHVDKTYDRNAVMYQQVEESDSYNHPVVLLSQNFLLSDHLMNTMGVNESKDILPSNNTLPNVFVILVISEPLIFGYEFIDGLLKQEYPKENIIICISTRSLNHSRILAKVKESNFAKIISTNSKDNLVLQRIEALEKFKASNSQYVLFLNSSVILHDTTTLKTLVKQDQNIIAPMIRKKIFQPSLKQTCYNIGYNESHTFELKFQNQFINNNRERNVVPSSTWANERYHHGSNYALYETQEIRKTKNYSEDLNFWGPSYYYSNDQDINRNSIPYRLESKDIGHTKPKRHGFKVYSAEDVKTILRVESLRYIYLLKKPMIQGLDLQSLKDAKNLDDSDYLITQILKQNETLYMQAERTYGELVNYRSIQRHNTSYYEFYQIIENFQLWANRYIQQEILVSIQQSSNDLLQTIPSIFHKTNCKDVYVTKSLFKTTFFEDLLALVKDVFDNMSTDFIHLRKVGFLQDWQSLLEFFIIPQFCNIFLGHINPYSNSMEGTYTFRKYLPNDGDIYHSTNWNHKYNILMPLTSGGEITFKRYNNCAITMEKNSIILFPGELTHVYKISSKRNEVILFSTKLHGSNNCHMVHGDSNCEGFDTEKYLHNIYKGNYSK